VAQIKVRRLTPDDQAAAWRLGSLTFGYHEKPMPEGWTSDSPGRTSYGAFDEDGRLIAKAVDRDQGQWFGGRIVPTCGVAGVAVVPDQRRKGLGRLILSHLLREARDRGAAISTLFPTTPFPYRRLGWEEVGALTYFALPAAALAGVRPSPRVTLRPGMPEDFPAMSALYREVARAGSGLMERSGPLFSTDPIDDFDGVTVATGPDGAVCGYASWNRGPRYDSTGKLTVYDLIGADDAATATLLHMVAGWASVAPNIVLRLTDQDPAFFHFASSGTTVESRQPWMARIVDAPAAVAARGWPPNLRGEIDLELTDDVCPWNEGRFRLTVSGGEGKLEPGGDGTVRVEARGFGPWFTGAASPALLRRAGLLGGGDEGTDAFLQTATAGPTPALLDYF
jgi:predicted acetyltransferase